MGFHKFETNIPGVWKIKPDVFGDKRGFFTELYNRKGFEEIGLGHLNFVQDNLSSSSKGIVRGLHFQAAPHAQGKLITVLQGKALDVAVDVRKDSPTYGQHVAVELDGDDLTFLYIPEGFAHGFQVISDQCLFCYKCTNFYNKSAEGGLLWNDPALGIPWNDIPPNLSEKDLEYPPLADFHSPF
ncbi:dTDP-4-dehydrorhamnose 3,5-epimerase [bacterium]|nr:dTDP-4-dehydrorhamnose 3,5-epimerase [bacterium]